MKKATYHCLPIPVIGLTFHASQRNARHHNERRREIKKKFKISLSGGREMRDYDWR